VLLHKPVKSVMHSAGSCIGLLAYNLHSGRRLLLVLLLLPVLLLLLRMLLQQAPVLLQHL
jgi:hypothetical protein